MQVNEKMAGFIEWAMNKGEDEIRRLICERLEMLKSEFAANGGFRDSDGFTWDDILEQSERADQWKRGGDCNRCRRNGYCGNQCRANRMLKEITTPFLYEMYLADTPEAAMREAANGLTPDALLDSMGVDHGKIIS